VQSGPSSSASRGCASGGLARFTGAIIGERFNDATLQATKRTGTRKMGGCGANSAAHAGASTDPVLPRCQQESRSSMCMLHRSVEPQELAIRESGLRVVPLPFLSSINPIQEISMKTKFALSAIAVATVALFSQGAFAQGSQGTTNQAAPGAASAVSKSERKADAAAATKSGSIATGQEASMSSGATKGSTVDKNARKAQAKADTKSGAIATGEEGSNSSGATKGSDTTRAARKAQAKADTKAKNIPTGEGAPQGK
jgi:hypothetical protein